MLILSIVFAVIAVDLYREYTIASEKGDSDQYLYLFMCFGFGLYSIVALSILKRILRNQTPDR